MPMTAQHRLLFLWGERIPQVILLVAHVHLYANQAAGRLFLGS